MAQVHNGVWRVPRYRRRYCRHPRGRAACLVRRRWLDRHPSLRTERSCGGARHFEAALHPPRAGNLARRDARRSRIERSEAERSCAPCEVCRADGTGFVRGPRHSHNSGTAGPIDRWLHSDVQATGRDAPGRVSSCTAIGIGSLAAEAWRRRRRRGLCRLVLRPEPPWSPISACLWRNARRLSFSVRRLRQSISFQTCIGADAKLPPPLYAIASGA
jgi:hypothetical protein